VSGQRGRRRSKKGGEAPQEPPEGPVDAAVDPEVADPAGAASVGAEPLEHVTSDPAEAAAEAEVGPIDEPGTTTRVGLIAPGEEEAAAEDPAPADEIAEEEEALGAGTRSRTGDTGFELSAEEDEEAERFEDDEGGPGLEKATATPASSDHLKTILESLLFVSDRPLPANRLARLARTRTAEVTTILEQLVADYKGRGIELVEVAGGYQFRSAASSAPFVRELVAKKPVRLSRAQIETLAILAYRQPMTRPELEEIRGVDCGSALKVLLDKGLLRILGRKDEAGRPLLYGTTPQFLEFFGLASLADLPTLREYGELTEESRALFQRKMGEAVDTIGDIAIEQHHYTDDEIEALERQARGEPEQQELPVPPDDDGTSSDLPSDDENDAAPKASPSDSEEDE
jgi:segregation and condensation protein B